MSPEQAQDSDITPQSDLFSLGSVMYEMLAGVPPFAAKGLTGLIHKVCNEDPKPLMEVRAEIPEPLWRVVKKMLEKELNRRYKTGAELVADLDEALDILEHAPLALSDAQKLERMAELDFFKEFSASELKEILKAATWQHIDADETIFSEGKKDRAFYVVADGAVSVTINGVRIRDLETGQCFGEMEYLSATGRTAAVTASRGTTVIKVERDFKEWASLPCQLRLNRVFQQVLVERLETTSKALARALH
jgi:hypothetical protein